MEKANVEQERRGRELPLKSVVHLLEGTRMTARRKAKREGHGAWVGVVSMERPRKAYLNTVDMDVPCALEVRTFEIADDELKYEDVDDSSILDSQRFELNGFRELHRLIDQLGVDASALAFAADTGYPL